MSLSAKKLNALSSQWNDESRSIPDLPDELWLQIFTKVPASALKHLSLTNTRLHNIGHDESLNAIWLADAATDLLNTLEEVPTYQSSLKSKLLHSRINLFRTSPLTKDKEDIYTGFRAFYSHAIKQLSAEPQDLMIALLEGIEYALQLSRMTRENYPRFSEVKFKSTKSSASNSVRYRTLEGKADLTVTFPAAGELEAYLLSLVTSIQQHNQQAIYQRLSRGNYPNTGNKVAVISQLCNKHLQNHQPNAISIKLRAQPCIRPIHKKSQLSEVKPVTSEGKPLYPKQALNAKCSHFIKYSDEQPTLSIIETAVQLHNQL